MTRKMKQFVCESSRRKENSIYFEACNDMEGNFVGDIYVKDESKYNDDKKVTSNNWIAFSSNNDTNIQDYPYDEYFDDMVKERSKIGKDFSARE